MAASKSETAKAKASAAEESTSEAASGAEPEPAAEPVTSTCVVNGGKGIHVGQAVNGKVCSYHAMHYDPNGNPR